MHAQFRPHPHIVSRPFSRTRRALTAAVIVGCATAVASAEAQAQRPQTTPPVTRNAPAAGALVGTLGPAAARALESPSSANQPRGTQRGAPNDARRGNTLRFGNGYIPLVVADAPVYSRGGSTLMVETVSPPVVSGTGWYPTMQPPTWRLVPDEHPVQAWRTVDVDDVVCNAMGACVEQTTRVIARWAPALRGYAFADRVGRVWLVE